MAENYDDAFSKLLTNVPRGGPPDISSSGIFSGGVAPQPQPTPAPPPPPVPEDAAPVPGQNELGTSTLEDQIAGQELKDLILRDELGSVAHGTPKVVQPGHFDTWRYGTNPSGQSNLEEATVSRPEEMGRILGGLQDEESRFANANKAIYDDSIKRTTELNAIASREHQQDLDSLERRQAQIDQQAGLLAAHQYDGGKFWRSGSGFFATLGAVFATLANPGQNIGLKLINSYIDREARQQQQEHENMQADLLNLRTNTGEYRKLMGDREAGNLMQVAQMKEVAAMQLQNLAMQMKSKEAIAKSGLIAEQLRQEAAQYRGEAMWKSSHPAGFEDPRLSRAHMANASPVGPQAAVQPATGQPNTAPAAGAGITGTGNAFVEAARNHLAQQAPMVNGKKGGPAPPVAETNPNAPEWMKQNLDKQRRESENLAEPGEAERAEESAKLMGISPQLYIAAERKMMRGFRNEAYQAVGGNEALQKNPSAFKVEYQKKKAELFEKVVAPQMQEMNKRLETLQDQKSVISMLRRANAELEADHQLAGGKGVDYAGIDRTLGQDWKEFVGPNAYAKVQRVREQMIKAGTPADVADRRTRAAMVYAGRLQRVISQYGHTLFGGALTDKAGSSGQSESTRLNTTISMSDPFYKIKHFTDDEARLVGSRHKLVTQGFELPAVLFFLRKHPDLYGSAVGHKGIPGVER